MITVLSNRDIYSSVICGIVPQVEARLRIVIDSTIIELV